MYNVKLSNLFYHCASIETAWWRRQERIDGCKNWIFRIFLCFLLSYYIFLDKIVWQLSFVVLNMIQYAFWLILWKYIFCHCQNSGLSLISVRCNIDPNIVYCIKKKRFCTKYYSLKLLVYRHILPVVSNRPYDPIFYRFLGRIVKFIPLVHLLKALVKFKYGSFSRKFKGPWT